MLSGRGGGGAGRGGNRIRPPRRMIRPLGGGAADSNDIEGPWRTISEAMTDIHDKNSSKWAFEQLYRACYKIVLSKKGEELYDRVRKYEENHFRTRVIPDIEMLVTPNLISVAVGEAGVSVNERRQMGEHFLRNLRNSWTHHNTSMNMVADILMYLDRGFSQDSRRPSIYTTCIGLYRDNILKSSIATNPSYNIFHILNSVVLDLINMERDGDVIDHYLIKSSIGMLDSLYHDDDEREGEKLYTIVFDPAFRDATKEYYRKESERLLRDGDAGTWLRHTRARLVEEFDRCETTIQRESRDECIKIVEQELITKHLDEFLNLEGSGLKPMLDNDRYEELGILYELVARVDEKKSSMRNIMSGRIVHLGVEVEKNLINMDFSNPQSEQTAAANGDEAADGAEKAKPQTLTAAAQQTAAAIRWVDEVLKLKDKYDIIWRDCFHKDLAIQTTLTKSFSDFINLFNCASEYVSLFIDENLRRGIRGKTEREVEEVLEKAITLIRYLTDKDMFDRYYQKHLAKRLLNCKSESHDVEKAMISRMKQELGNQFTAKFEGMFKDMQMSGELTASYRDHARSVADVERKQPELSVQILTSNNWPPEVMGRNTQLAGSTDCNYPKEIDKLKESLTAFYLSNRTGRKLNWVGTAGNADIKCTFPAVPGAKGPLSRERRYELNVSTLGMVVLMLFNDVGETAMSIQEIQAKTNIPTPDLLRTLSSLSIPPKARVLLKEPAGKRIEPSDTFRFNAGFVSKTVKIKAPIVNSAAKVEGDEERKQTEEKNRQSRAHIIDAAVVRTMKERKELKHAQLVSEVVTQLAARFQPEVSFVKKRIEDLIVRDYLERVEEADPPMYRYVA